MKAKQQLEEQIIDLFLNKKINNFYKEGLLTYLNDLSVTQLNRLEEVLNNPVELAYSNKAAKRIKALFQKEYQLDDLDEERVRDVFDSLVEKGFLNVDDQKNYSLSDYLSLDPDILTDEEFMHFYRLIQMKLKPYFIKSEE